MNASQHSTRFSRTIYRDFALFALAAVSVGFAASLVLATAIVLIAPAPERTADETRANNTAVAYAPGNHVASLRQPAAS